MFNKKLEAAKQKIKKGRRFDSVNNTCYDNILHIRDQVINLYSLFSKLTSSLYKPYYDNHKLGSPPSKTKTTECI